MKTLCAFLFVVFLCTTLAYRSTFHPQDQSQTFLQNRWDDVKSLPYRLMDPVGNIPGLRWLSRNDYSRDNSPGIIQQGWEGAKDMVSRPFQAIGDTVKGITGYGQGSGRQYGRGYGQGYGQGYGGFGQGSRQGWGQDQGQSYFDDQGYGQDYGQDFGQDYGQGQGQGQGQGFGGGLTSGISRLFGGSGGSGGSGYQSRDSDSSSWGSSGWLPSSISGHVFVPCDVKDAEKENIINCELPGVAKTDVLVDVKEGMLIIRGEKKVDSKVLEKKDEETLERIERQFGKFKRVFQLSKSVDPRDISAQLNHGVLEVIVPKPKGEEGKGRMKVEIK